jgi:hypothetical protein
MAQRLYWRKWIGLLVIAALVAAALVSWQAVQAQVQQVPVPPVVEPCVDRSDVFAAGTVDVMATETVADTDYYLLYTYEAGPEAQRYPSPLLVSVAAGTCQVALWNTAGDFLAYADYVPLSAAIAFREIEFARQLERLGRSSFIEAFDLSARALLEEESAALERLGLLAEIQERQG